MQKETVQIEIDRLQLLNDRICQTLEALNQVRLSARCVTQPVGYTQPTFGAFANPWLNQGLGYGLNNHGFVPGMQIPFGYDVRRDIHGLPVGLPVNNGVYGQQVLPQWGTFGYAPVAQTFAPAFSQPVVADSFIGRTDLGRTGGYITREELIERDRLAQQQAQAACFAPAYSTPVARW